MDEQEIPIAGPLPESTPATKTRNVTPKDIGEARHKIFFKTKAKRKTAKVLKGKVNAARRRKVAKRRRKDTKPR